MLGSSLSNPGPAEHLQTLSGAPDMVCSAVRPIAVSERKWPWPNSTYYPRCYLEGLRKTATSLSQYRCGNRLAHWALPIEFHWIREDRGREGVGGGSLLQEERAAVRIAERTLSDAAVSSCVPSAPVAVRSQRTGENPSRIVEASSSQLCSSTL